jgi:hypothetical protein
MKIPNPKDFGVWVWGVGVGVVGKKIEARKSNRISAKCAIPYRAARRLDQRAPKEKKNPYLPTYLFFL